MGQQAVVGRVGCCRAAGADEERTWDEGAARSRAQRKSGRDPAGEVDQTLGRVSLGMVAVPDWNRRRRAPPRDLQWNTIHGGARVETSRVRDGSDQGRDEADLVFRPDQDPASVFFWVSGAAWTATATST